jgi:DNA-binding XRE family transcriptional regulator
MNPDQIKLHLAASRCRGRSFAWQATTISFPHFVGDATSDESRRVPVRAHFFNFRRFTMKYSRSGTGVGMSENTIERGAAEVALAFGSTVRRRRKALNMRQDELALATGVGRRFLIDLEAGKPTCQLGRSLLVANVLGLRVTDLLASESLSLCAPKAGQELPDFPDVVEEPDGQSTGIL